MKAMWNCREFKITKYDTELDYANSNPSSIEVHKGNVVTLNGLQTLWHLINGTKPASYSAALNVIPYNAENTYIGVGNGGSTASATNSKLDGSSTAYAKVVIDDKTESVFNYNRTAGGCSMTIQAKFGSDEAIFNWKEWGIFNGNPSSVNSSHIASTVQDEDINTSAFNIVMLNHKVEEMGTKAKGSVWVAQVTIDLLNNSVTA